MALEKTRTLFPPLCCYDPQVAPFGRYALEMLYAEGLTGAEEQNVGETPLTADTLQARQAVIVAPCGEDTGRRRRCWRRWSRGRRRSSCGHRKRPPWRWALPASSGFPLTSHYYGRAMDYRQTECPEAESLCREETLWMGHPAFLGTQADMDDIADAFVKVKEHAAELRSLAAV